MVDRPFRPGMTKASGPAATMRAYRGVTFPRRVALTYHPFESYFRGFDKIDAVRGIFGAKTSQVLRSLKVEFFSSKWGYMGVSDEDGHLVVSAHYLRTGKPRDVYMDVIHELVHVKQFRDGRELFPEGFEYATAPTEIEAYKVCIAEGRRLGMSDHELFEYLKVEWVDEAELRRLAKNVGVKAPPKRKGRRKR